jgi:hypothetical protein
MGKDKSGPHSQTGSTEIKQGTMAFFTHLRQPRTLDEVVQLSNGGIPW